MASLRSFVVGSLTALVPAFALAAAFGHKAGTETFTEPAGRVGAKQADQFTTADYYGLQMMKATQYTGKICSLDVEQSAFATRTLARLPPLKVCEPTGGEQWKGVDVGSGLFVTGVAVCTGPGKDDVTLRGIELAGSTLADDGTLNPSKKSVKLEFGGCKKWQPRKTCPAGTVATGVRGFADDDTGGLVGIALRCHALEQRGK